MDLKRLAAERAVDLLGSAKVVGLGSGSTAACFVEALASRRGDGGFADIVGIPTSEATAELARRLEIPLEDLDHHQRIDVTVDGADEVALDLGLIKGLGGALAREKIVATASQRMIVVVDESKVVCRLGERAPLPVEVLPFGWQVTERRLRDLGARPVLRADEQQPFRTDQGNLVLDCGFPLGLDNPDALDIAIKRLPGVVEHGLFLGLADLVVVAGSAGVRLLERD